MVYIFCININPFRNSKDEVLKIANGTFFSNNYFMGVPLGMINGG